MKSVRYCAELDCLTVVHELTICDETLLPLFPVEWSSEDLVRALESRPNYKGVADIFDLFDWVEIGEF